MTSKLGITMDVLVVHPYMSVFGGGESVCLHILKALLEDGHYVNLVSERVNPKKVEKFMGSNLLNDLTLIPYEKFKLKVKKFSVYQRLIHQIVSKYRLRNKIGKFDLEFLTQDVAFTLDAGKVKIAYVHFPQFLAHLEISKPKVRWFWKAYYSPVEFYWKKQIEKINLFLCNSNFTKDKIRERWGKDATVIYPPVDIEKFRPAPLKENTVVTVGRFVPSKNYEVVNEVAKLLPETDFKIIGIKQDFGYYKKIERSKPKNVALLTNLTREEVISELARAKVYLHTMVNEHFGISIVEAMASGCVPIVHNSGGAKEVIGNLGYAYNTVKECADCLHKAFTENIDAMKLVNYAKRFSAKRFEQEIKEVIKRISGKGL